MRSISDEAILEGATVRLLRFARNDREGEARNDGKRRTQGANLLLINNLKLLGAFFFVDVKLSPNPAMKYHKVRALRSQTWARTRDLLLPRQVLYRPRYPG